MGIKKFEDILAWQEARKMTRMVYSITSQGPLRRDVGCKDQIQRASVSTMTNIAEGFGAGSSKEFSRFLSYARRSAMEVQSLLYVTLDAGYIDREQFNAFYDQARLTIRLVSKFKSTLDQ
jgi:four helix bundle protein